MVIASGRICRTSSSMSRSELILRVISVSFRKSEPTTAPDTLDRLEYSLPALRQDFRSSR